MSDSDEIEARANALPVMFFGNGDDSRCWVIDDAGNTLATNAAPDLARFVVNARDDVPNLCRALRERDETIANMTNAINAADVSAAHDRDTIAALRLGIDARVRTLTQERDDAAEIATRLRDELNDARAMLREIRRTVIASVRGAEHSVTLTDEEVDAHAASTPVDVGNLVARMQRAEAERDAAKAIIAGRTTPPTDTEIEARNAAGGTWYVASTHGRALTTTKRDAIAVRDHVVANGYPSTWWAIDVRRRPCAWPVVKAKR